MKLGEKYSENWTIRDEFASRAMQAIQTNESLAVSEEYYSDLANDAYEIADAMLKARKK